MCDYSLKHVKSRPARVGEKLITHHFGTGTRGFCATDDRTTAVCVLPGTELAFTDDIRCSTGRQVEGLGSRYSNNLEADRCRGCGSGLSAMFKRSAKAPDEVAIPLRPRVGMAIDVAVFGLFSAAFFALDATSR